MMKLLRMPTMKPYMCLMGGNGVLCEQVIQRAADQPPPTPPASSSAGGHNKNISRNSKRIKLIKPDGVVSVYKRQIKASELMEEYPKHMVCRSDSFYIGQKIPHLSHHDKLQKGHTYFLLPSHIFHSALSFLTIASFASPPPPPPPPPQPSSSTQLQPPPPPPLHNINSLQTILRSKREMEEEQMKSRAAIMKKAAASPPAFDIQKTKSGTLRIRVSEVFISQLIMEQQRDYDNKQEAEEEEKRTQLLCTTPQLHKDYKQLVMDSRIRLWKPKLDMISETKRKALLSSASFGIKRNKSSSTSTNKNNNVNTTTTTTSKKKKKSSSSGDQLQLQGKQSQSPTDHHELHSSKTTSAAKPVIMAAPCKCKLRRFKLKLGGLTTTTSSSSNSPSLQNIYS